VRLTLRPIVSSARAGCRRGLHQSQPWAEKVFSSRVFHAIVRRFSGGNWTSPTRNALPKVMRRAAIERIHSALRIADLAFDVNLPYALKGKDSGSWKCPGMDRQTVTK